MEDILSSQRAAGPRCVQPYTRAEIDALLDQCSGLECVCDESSENLYDAIHATCYHCARGLVAAYLTNEGDKRRNALDQAVQEGNIPIIVLLLESLAGETNGDGLCQLSFLLTQTIDKENAFECARALSSYPKEWAAMEGTELMHACLCGDMAAARTLLHQAGAKGKHGETALMIAAMANNAPLVELLLDAEVGATMSNGCTALMRAASYGNTSCVKLLLQEAGKQDSDGRTALMTAAECGFDDIVSLLIDAEARLQTSIGGTALIIAVEAEHLECVRLLVQKEAGMEDSNGWTALMIEAEDGNLEGLKILAPYEAGRQRPDGYTALYFAVYHNQIACVEYLAPLEKHIETQPDANPLNTALINQNARATAVLLEDLWPSTSEEARKCLKEILIEKADSETAAKIMDVVARHQEEYAQWIGPEFIAAYRGDIVALHRIIANSEPNNNLDISSACNIAAQQGWARVLRHLVSYQKKNDDYLNLSYGIANIHASHSWQETLRVSLFHCDWSFYTYHSPLYIAVYQNLPQLARRLKPYFADFCDSQNQNAVCRIIDSPKSITMQELSLDKHFGWLYKSRTPLTLASYFYQKESKVEGMLRKNPIALKEIQIARKLFLKAKAEGTLEKIKNRFDSVVDTQPQRQPFRRQIQAETNFNRSLLRLAFEAACRTAKLEKAFVSRAANSIRTKQALVKTHSRFQRNLVIAYLRDEMANM